MAIDESDGKQATAHRARSGPHAHPAGDFGGRRKSAICLGRVPYAHLRSRRWSRRCCPATLLRILGFAATARMTGRSLIEQPMLVTTSGVNPSPAKFKLLVSGLLGPGPGVLPLLSISLADAYCHSLLVWIGNGVAADVKCLLHSPKGDGMAGLAAAVAPMFSSAAALKTP